MVATAAPGFTIPDSKATRDGGDQKFNVTVTGAAVTTGNANTVGVSVVDLIHEQREATALGAHAAMLVRYQDWQPIPAHTHPQLTSD
ncbi:MAG: hypothetical protein M3P30_04810 [Chloroflexota bacterium]|nr:hypothetical protein [Chloroflexota bacterium]